MKLPFFTTNNRKTAWDKWPKWDGENSFRTHRFPFSFSGSDYSGKTSLEKVCFLILSQLRQGRQKMGSSEPSTNHRISYSKLLSLFFFPSQIIRDYIYIDKLDVFQAYCYKKAYLKDSTAHRSALLHYLLIGERRGYPPNAFFDPEYYSSLRPRKWKSSAFAEYLRSNSPSTPSPSANFDHQWYCSQNPDWHEDFSHPFLHFWHKGVFERRDPAPHFDIDFFTHAAGRGHPDIKMVLYEVLTRESESVPLNAQELRKRQDKFYASIVLHVERELAGPRYPFLVFVQASEGYWSKLWDEPRGFDLMLNYYDEAEVWPPTADYVFIQMGTKATAIRKILEERPELFERYEAVLFLDDDVEIDNAGVMLLFQTMKKYKLDLVQASLTADSECYFDIIKHPPEGSAVCALTSVEIMMPAVSRRVLNELGWVFNEGISGWAIDFLLSAQVRQRYGNKIALIGEVAATHARSTDVADGDFYRFLGEHGIDPNVEAGYIAWKFGVDDSACAISRNVQPLDFS
jgi:hypothetical protein